MSTEVRISCPDILKHRDAFPLAEKRGLSYGEQHNSALNPRNSQATFADVSYSIENSPGTYDEVTRRPNVTHLFRNNGARISLE